MSTKGTAAYAINTKVGDTIALPDSKGLSIFTIKTIEAAGTLTFKFTSVDGETYTASAATILYVMD